MSPRRIRWIVRVVVFGLLGLLAVAVLSLREPAEDRFLTGSTAQGEDFEMQTSAHGEVYGFATDVTARCPDGTEWPVRWFPPQSTATYRRDGERLVVRERWRRRHRDDSFERGWARLEGRVDGDGGAAEGVIDVEMWFTAGGVEYARCRATGVRWRAREE